MQIENYFYYYTSALSPDVCQQIIDLGDNQIKEEKLKGTDVSGTTFGFNHKQEDESKEAHSDETLEDRVKKSGKSTEDVVKNSYIRDSEITWLTNEWIYDIIKPYINEGNRKSGWRYEYDTFENFQYTTYRPGGFYNWHADGGSCHLSMFKKYIPGISPVREDGRMEQNYTNDNNWVGKIRKLSLTINLNTPGDYEGGNLKFDFGPHAERERYYECVEMRPQGSIILFPSWLHHQVTPITKGIRKSLVLWCLGRPFK